MNLNDYFKSNNPGTSLLLYGKSGTQKTFLAGKLSQEFNLYYFDLEQGIKTLKGLDPKWLERITYFPIPDIKQYPIASETIDKLFSGGTLRICPKHGKVSCPKCQDSQEINIAGLTSKDVLVIDSATQLGISYINSIILRLQKKTPQLDLEAIKPEWNDYRWQGNLLNNFLTGIQNLTNTNRIVICHEEQTKVGNIEGVVPHMGTSNYSKDDLGKFFDHVVWANVHVGKHKFISTATKADIATAKSRTGIAIEDMKEPSLIPFFK